MFYRLTKLAAVSLSLFFFKKFIDFHFPPFRLSVCDPSDLVRPSKAGLFELCVLLVPGQPGETQYFTLAEPCQHQQATRDPAFARELKKKSSWNGKRKMQTACGAAAGSVIGCVFLLVLIENGTGRGLKYYK